uniref:Uncharacterized protein n=1 Tax=Oryza brachyantha TaxID=4533 RepID=J3LIN6_ORYBR
MHHPLLPSIRATNQSPARAFFGSTTSPCRLPLCCFTPRLTTFLITWPSTLFTI